MTEAVAPTTATGLSPAARSISASPSPRQQAARPWKSPGSGATSPVPGVGIYSDPWYVIFCTSNGERYGRSSLTARPLSGQPTPSSESSEVHWVPASELSGYTMDRSMRIRINDFLSRSESPVIT